MSDEKVDLVNLLSSKFDEIAKQLVHNNATMSRIERDMANKIAHNTTEIVEIKKVVNITDEKADTAIAEIAELKEENKNLRSDMSKMADELKNQGTNISKVTASHLDSMRRRYRNSIVISGKLVPAFKDGEDIIAITLSIIKKLSGVTITKTR